MLTNFLDMDTQVNRDERIEIRVSSLDKQIFQQAQKLSGDKSFSSFIIRIVKEQAQKIVEKNKRIIATEEDRNKFFDTVFSDAEPNQALTEAAEKYKSQRAQ